MYIFFLKKKKKGKMPANSLLLHRQHALHMHTRKPKETEEKAV